MALNSHQKRILTALAIAPVLLWALFAGGRPLLFLTIFIALLGQWELHALLRPQSGPVRAVRVAEAVGLVCGLLVVLGGYVGRPDLVMGGVSASFWLCGLVFLFAFGLAPQPEQEPAGSSDVRLSATAVLIPAAGVLYVPATLQLCLAFSPRELLLCLLCAVASDTAAFYAGRTFGRAKLWPAVSPGKTWAGGVGGLSACVLVCLLFGLTSQTAPLAASWPVWLGLGLTLGVGAQLGDLFESALKRASGIKDSGAILPGHGGLLDRIDSVLPVVAIYAALRSGYAFF